MSDDLNPLAPVEGANSTPAAPAPATPPAAASPAATPQATPQATPAPQAPEGYVPSYRIREAREAAAREARSQFQQEQATLQQQLDTYKRQIGALTGVVSSNPTEADAIKSQFFNLFPWAKKLEEKFGDFESLIEKAGDIEAQNKHYWTAYSNQQMDRLYHLAGESYGAPLSDEGKRQLHSSFVGFVQSSPELAARFASDPSIVDDFWKAFTSSFVDPVRRGAATQVVQRAAGIQRLPQDAPSGAPQASGAPKLSGLEERAAAAWAQYNNKAGA